MKISGPKPPQMPACGDVTGPQTPKPAAKIGPGAFDKLLAGNVQEAAAPTRSGAIEQIQAQLKAGEINSTQAADKIVEEIVRSRLQAIGPALQAQLRSHLKQLLSEDPYLSAKLRDLAG